MARTDLLLNLARAGSKGDQAGVRRTLEAIVADERGKQHHVVAEQLSEVLSISHSASSNTNGRLASLEASSLVTELTPRRSLEDMVLPAATRKVVEELVEEQQRAELLRSHGLEPRNRLLLVGPPGNGKTSLAEAVAGQLAIPLVVVRYEAVIGSYLGETALRLAHLFEQIRLRRCLLFFDEFDAIGKERGDRHETGEIKRVVSSLLLNVDALPSYVVIVAATNHAELLDRAVWRRFQLRLELPAPALPQILEWLRRFESQLGLRLGLGSREVVQQLRGLSYAELDEFCADLQRRLVLAGPSAELKTIVSTRLAQWRMRTTSRR
jgi:AAA+ superfamily predicted ATPase